MRIFSFVAISFILMAFCDSPVYGSSGLLATNLITSYGEWECFSNVFVDAREADRKITVRCYEGDDVTAQTASDWKTGDGWFVFVEDAEKIWIFNGKNLRLLLIKHKVGSAIYRDSYPEGVPELVSREILIRDSMKWHGKQGGP